MNGKGQGILSALAAVVALGMPVAGVGAQSDAPNTLETVQVTASRLQPQSIQLYTHYRVLDSIGAQIVSIPSIKLNGRDATIRKKCEDGTVVAGNPVLLSTGNKGTSKNPRSLAS